MASSDVFGAPGYKVTVPHGAMCLLRPDGSLVAEFGLSTPESIITKCAQADVVVQRLWIEQLHAINLGSLERLLQLQAATLQAQFELRRMIRGGAAAEAFGSRVEERRGSG